MDMPLDASEVGLWARRLGTIRFGACGRLETLVRRQLPSPGPPCTQRTGACCKHAFGGQGRKGRPRTYLSGLQCCRGQGQVLPQLAPSKAPIKF